MSQRRNFVSAAFPFTLCAALACLSTAAQSAGNTAALDYEGDYCDGSGDAKYLQLIDESFHFFHASSVVPNLTHIYQQEWDTFTEGFGWGGWWIQNSYGFSLCATPFLQEPWFTILQQSWDLHWTKQGDGIRMGRFAGRTSPLYGLVAPDGALGDTATIDHIVYKQGDGAVHTHDWYYEGTAAGVVMEAEILLRSRDVAKAKLYLPKMHRACEHIELTRDPGNNLFLVGPACNLLAPSYGGVKQPDGSFGKGYLAGLSITYTAALERMAELYKLTGNSEKQRLYEKRLEITRASLPQLLTDEGYFVKSIEKNGVKHGVAGQEQFGYFEGVANADAMCLRVTGDAQARRIYNKIASLPGLRPFDFLLTNAPGLDDTYWNYGSRDVGNGFHQFGDWVNGGVWGTVEGRAIMGYYRVEAFDDIFASAQRAMKWAKDFRMDAPWCQRGENTFNWWSDAENARKTSIMVDNFAIPAATVRGLFEWVYKADRIVVYPHVPNSITFYRQKEPVWFGCKRITIECANGLGPISSVSVNGTPLVAEGAGHFSLRYDELPESAHVVVVMEGAEQDFAALSGPPAAPTPAMAGDDSVLPEGLGKKRAVLDAMLELLKHEPDSQFDKAFVREARAAMDALCLRVTGDFGPGHFRPMTGERVADIVSNYEAAANAMYIGLTNRMTLYQNGADENKRRVAELFAQASGTVSE